MLKRIPFGEIAIILALTSVAVVGYKYSPLLLPKADLTIEPPPGCDLNRQACYADMPGGGRIELNMEPRPIPVAKPFQVDIKLSGVSVHALEIDFSGMAMNMGFNRKTFIAKSDGRFSAEAMLPVCVTGRMEWRATVLLETVNQRIAIPFVFESPAMGN